MTEIAESSPKQNESIINRTHIVLAILLSVFVISKVVLLLVSPRAEVYGSDLTIDNILQAVNRERSLRNFLTLNTNAMLGTAAQSKADDMQARHYFAHVDPDGNYIWPKITAAGYTPYVQLGENLAIEFYDTESLVSAWMNSPTHRANILNDGFRDQGMGLNFGDSSAGQYHSIVVNTFGTLLVKKVEAAPAPTTQTAPTTEQTVSGAATPKPSTQTTTKQVSTSKTTTAPAPKTTTPPPQPEPAKTPAPSETQTAQPLSPRGDFALAFNDHAAPAATQTTATPNETETAAPAVVNPVEPTSQADNNRYFTLAFGFALLLFLATDLRGVVEKKSAALGKKLNNVVLLLIAIAVIAAFYWL